LARTQGQPQKWLDWQPPVSHWFWPEQGNPLSWWPTSHVPLLQYPLTQPEFVVHALPLALPPVHVGGWLVPQAFPLPQPPWSPWWTQVHVPAQSGPTLHDMQLSVQVVAQQTPCWQ
jgi:hypothetical protein